MFIFQRPTQRDQEAVGAIKRWSFNGPGAPEEVEGDKSHRNVGRHWKTMLLEDNISL